MEQIMPNEATNHNEQHRGFAVYSWHMPLSCAAVIQRDFVDRDYSVV
jgi:hypothetical protein